MVMNRLFHVDLERITTSGATVAVRAKTPRGACDQAKMVAGSARFVHGADVGAVTIKYVLHNPRLAEDLPPIEETHFDAYRVSVSACVSHPEFYLPRLEDYGSWAGVTALNQMAGYVDLHGITTEAFDELIHEFHSADAAEVNNGGLHAQISYLTGAVGLSNAWSRLIALVNDDDQEWSEDQDNDSADGDGDDEEQDE